MSAKDFNARLLAPVMALPRRPLSSKLSTDSCSMRFSLRAMISGAFNSSKRRRRLLRLITRRYRSLRSEVAKRPPSNGTKGRRSGGNTGNTSKIIHSGLMPDFLKASSTFRRLAFFLILSSEPVRSLRSFSISESSSMLSSKSLIPSAPILATNSSPNSSRFASKSSSVMMLNFFSGVMPGSTTTYASKYSTRSMSRKVMSRTIPKRLGKDFRNQMCAQGADKSMWPMRSRRTLVWVTSTPHFSQMTPRCFKRLYLPHRHS